MPKSKSNKGSNVAVSATPRKRVAKPPKPAKAPNSAEMAGFLDQLLNHATVGDYSAALNGLQLENSGRATRIGAAVDACEATILQAVERGIDFLIVHHGLFWTGISPVRGAAYRKLRKALEGDLAIYSSHLPLDLHPRFGNNARLARVLGLRKTAPFFMEKGSLIGLRAEEAMDRSALHERLGVVVNGPVKLIPGGPARVHKIGIITGGAGAELARVVAEGGVDTFITGEGPHWTYTLAEELGVNVLYAGHYATETFGVRAVAEHLSERTGLPWEFLDHPTGL